MRKLLNRIVNAYEVFCWEEDFSQEMPDVLGEEEELADIEVSEDEEQPSWSVSVSYLNGEKQQMKGFDIPIRVNELALDLLQYFENDEDADADDPYIRKNRISLAEHLISGALIL